MTRLQQLRKDWEHGLVPLLTVPIKHTNKVLVLLKQFDNAQQENVFHVYRYQTLVHNDWQATIEIKNASLADCLKQINRDSDLTDDYCEIAIS